MIRSFSNYASISALPSAFLYVQHANAFRMLSAVRDAVLYITMSNTHVTIVHVQKTVFISPPKDNTQKNLNIILPNEHMYHVYVALSVTWCLCALT